MAGVEAIATLLLPPEPGEAKKEWQGKRYAAAMMLMDLYQAIVHAGQRQVRLAKFLAEVVQARPTL